LTVELGITTTKIKMKTKINFLICILFIYTINVIEA
jgi:hypothetical protein